MVCKYLVSSSLAVICNVECRYS